ncbi:response regulator transcription factor [Flavobacterium sp. KACC 22761]|uniref:response regulator transcription factor n=1 Tax=Flavobacterium sp. KACC 22761 TaxID=3092665 RepID=UPI002A75689F|nr:response regulator transcription factor [Flavobacterium sp. KACC 22761]WPO77825.1 response regulator transcription factor [Flavobacterium sp. KACC 22761]
MPLNILIVDDHPMTVDSYVNLLSDNSLSTTEIFFHKKYNCENAYKEITLLKKQQLNIDFAILDVNLPSYPELNILNGIDLAAVVRKTHPQCKILLLTMHTEAFIVNRILNDIKPEGFIYKGEINFESFPVTCKKILAGEIIYSSEIIKSQKEFAQKNYDWDKFDTEILNLLAKGVKTIDIPSHIPLSISSIEKRKANIKNRLLLKSGSDTELINKARQLGLL